MGEFCSEHTKLLKDVSEIKTDVKWLKEDRISQKQRYLRKKDLRLKIWCGIATAFASVVSYAFVHREEARITIKMWLMR